MLRGRSARSNGGSASSPSGGVGVVDRGIDAFCSARTDNTDADADLDSSRKSEAGENRETGETAKKRQEVRKKTETTTTCITELEIDIGPTYSYSEENSEDDLTLSRKASF